MQPQVVGSAPAIQPAPISTPSPPIVGGKRPNNTMIIHTIMLVTALILAFIGMTGDAWSVEETSTTTDVLGVEVTTTAEQKVGLGDASVTVCINGECETEVADLSETYDNCTAQAADLELNSSTIEEMCGTYGDMASAGFTGTLFIILGILAIVTTLVATFFSFRGTPLPFSQYYPFGGAALILMGVIAWYLMMPDSPEGSDPSFGLNGWMTIVSALLVAGAGGFQMVQGSGTTTSPTSPQVSIRLPGLGARTLTADADAREFVLRETAMGNQTLSIVEDGDLFRITRAIRGESGTHSEDLFMSRMDALCGFTHARFDWLDTTRYLWNLLAVGGLVLTILAFENPSLIFYTNWFILIFAAGTIFSMLQFADPELITFETNTGKHRLLIYRAGSNRQLTNASMDIIDSIMRDALRGEQIDPSPLNAVADAIEADMAEARRAAEEAAAAAEAERIQAEAIAKAQAEHQAQLEAQALEQAREQVAATQTPATPHPVAIAPAQSPTQAPASPPAPAPVPAQPQTQVMTPPTTAPPPTSIPPVMNPPPPAFTPAPPPPAPSTPTPPPPAPMPPPSGMGAPLPPPPLSMDMGGMPDEITPAPEIPMQAAPRDDSLSEGEKENILSELGED